MARLYAILLAFALIAFPFTAPADEVIDINTADAAELARVLDGVGRARAEAIVEHREKFGPFTSVEELRYVTGIGASTVERNRARMTVGGQTRAAASAQN
jgi:competence protein ComEA